MRPVKLIMKAFGPYSSDEVVDFRKLEDNNLFLITGATGAGKTTLFDAITYALYGEASGDDRDDKNLISDFAAPDKITQIIFEFSLGNKYYRVSRTPEQKRKKQRGEGFTTQPPEASFYEIDKNGEEVQLLASRKIRDVNERITELIGLDSNQFKQIIMLPQNAFRELLTSKSDERQKILQKLFLTQKYQLFEEKLKNREKNLTGELETINFDIKHQIDEVQVSEEEENEFFNLKLNSEDLETFLSDLNRFIEYAVSQKNQLKASSSKTEELKKKIEEKISEAKMILEKFEERERVEAELKKLDSKNNDINELDERLKKAKKALLVLDKELLLNQYNKESEEKEKALVDIKKELDKTEIELEAIKKQNIKAEKEWKPELEELKKNVNTLLEYEKELASVQEIQKTTDKLKSRLETLENEIQKTDKFVEKLSSNTEVLKKDIKSEEELPEKKDKLIILLNKNKDEKYKNKTLMDLLSQYGELSTKRKELLQKYATKKIEIDQKEIQINDKNKKLTDLKEIEKKNLAYMLAKNLKENAPCPVCGSIHHQHLATHSTGIDEKAIEILEKELENIKSEKNQLLGTLGIIKKNGTETRDEMNKCWTKITTVLENELAEDEKTFLSLMQKHQAQTETLQTEFKTLSSQMNKINDTERILKEKRASLETSEKELKTMRDKGQILSKKYSEEKVDYTKNETQLESIRKKIPEQYLNVSFLKEAIRHNQKRREDLESAIKRCSDSLNSKNMVHASLMAKKEAGEKQLSEIKGKQMLQKSIFEASIKEAAFSSIDAYNDSKMKKTEITAGEQKVLVFRKTYDEKKNRAITLNRELKDISRPQLLEFEEEKKRLEKEILKIESNITRVEERIKNNRDRFEALSVLKEKRAGIYKEYEIYGYLKNLTTGRNAYRITFERFVQTAFLDDILIAANQRLEKMTDGRYYLNRQVEVQNMRSTNGLDIEVFDQYTGESRHVKTLSGGEGFKASLAMALGLSEVVQSYAGGVSLETLFIDEGFGSLDSESLDSAIKTLMELQSSGRLVGIISHVAELKERIDAYLEVISTKTGSYTRFYIP